MTPDWKSMCVLATSFHIEVWGKELWLVKHDTSLTDCWIEFDGRLVNIPFRPHLLAAKAEAKDPFLVERFTYYACMWSEWRPESEVYYFGAQCK